MTTPVDTTRQHLLDTATRLMSHKGYTAVGLSQLLATAGVPKGSFYYYFKSKEAFGKALLDNYFCHYGDTMRQLFEADASGADRLLRYFQRWQDNQCSEKFAQKCLVVKLAAEVCDLSEAMRQTLDFGTQSIIGQLASCVEAGVADGSIRTDTQPAELASQLYQLWLGASLLGKVGQAPNRFSIAMSLTKQLLGITS